MDKQAKIFVAGHRGMVGSAIVRRLRAEGYGNLLLRTRDQLDLRDQAAVAAFFREEQPEYVFLAAAKVGGILANSSQPAEFIHDNLQIQCNTIHNAWLSGVKRLLFLGSTCIYPKHAPQPMREEHLLTSPLEPTNDAYAVAKIAGIYQCRSYNRQYGTRFLAAMPNNLYGMNDNFDLEKSHVMPALIRKFHEAKAKREELGVRREDNPLPLTPHPSPDREAVVVWGSGSPLREFLHVDDLADACLFLMNLNDAPYDVLLHDPLAPALINVGSGEELAIRDLALLVKRVVGFEGELVFDAGKPDGTPRKLADASRIHALGWRHRIGLEEGVRATYEWYRDNVAVAGR
ncbi:MAG: GDP-L-fucose synthase [Deltaproteobacteria bacterium]|nr:GDP-L-fucose synthase [Deltaproteobacteria bacterium]